MARLAAVALATGPEGDAGNDWLTWSLRTKPEWMPLIS